MPEASSRAPCPSPWRIARRPAKVLSPSSTFWSQPEVFRPCGKNISGRLCGNLVGAIVESRPSALARRCVADAAAGGFANPFGAGA